MAEVKLINISKNYDSVTAVKDVNVTIYDNEFVVLVGPSGCGKSTTLRMIAGLEEITSGELYIDGKLVNDLSPKDRDIAMVFQNYALYPHMTVYENMAFGLKIRKMPKGEIKQRVSEAAKILELENYLDRKPRALSGGQRQRVAVGRAIVRKPKVFLFDEPLSNLDAKLRVQMRTEISRLHKSLNATMIYVTHDQTEAMTMGDRIVVMKDGYVQQIDKPLSLYDNPVNKFTAGFIGSPAMNFYTGYVQITADEVSFKGEKGELNFTFSKNFKRNFSSMSGKVYVGIRPEDIHLSKVVNATEIETNLEVVEPMGNEIYLYFTLEGVQTTARVNSRHVPEVDKRVKLYFDLREIHIFDFETEQRIV